MSPGARGTLRLGYTIGAGLDVVPRLLRTYHDREPAAVIETEEYDFTDPSAGLRDNLVHAAVVRPPLGLPGLVSVELATEQLVASLPEDHPLAARTSLSVAEVLPEPIIAAPVSPGPWRDYWLLSEYRPGPPPVVAEAVTLDAEMHLVARWTASSPPAANRAAATRDPSADRCLALQFAPAFATQAMISPAEETDGRDDTLWLPYTAVTASLSEAHVIFLTSHGRQSDDDG